MGETIHHVNGIAICAAIHGHDDGLPLLLVNGLGGQLVSWDPDMIAAFVDRGFRVVTFDNRDTGRSTHFDEEVDFFAVLGEVADGDVPEAPYTLSDMAADAAGLLDALEIDAAHVLGISMGGMIVQTMAIEHAAKVRSVTSIMSTTGDPDVGQPTDEAIVHLLAPAATTEDEAVAEALLGEEVWGSPSYPDPEGIAARARREWNRVQNPAGVERQLVAVAASPPRSTALRDVTMPFTVVHGTADTLVTPSGGARTAQSVPHATHIEIDGMGHNLPRPLWPEIVDIVERTASAVNA